MVRFELGNESTFEVLETSVRDGSKLINLFQSSKEILDNLKLKVNLNISYK